MTMNVDTVAIQETQSYINPSMIFNTPDAYTPEKLQESLNPQIQFLAKRMQVQQTTFQQQLQDLHRLINIHTLLTNTDPLTGSQIVQPTPVPSFSPPPAKVEKKKQEEASTPFEEQLSILLDRNGAVASLDLMNKLVKLLTMAKSNTEKSLLLTVIQKTTYSSYIQKFVQSAEGINTLGEWTNLAKKDGQIALLRLLLKVWVNLNKICAIELQEHQWRTHILKRINGVIFFSNVC